MTCSNNNPYNQPKQPSGAVCREWPPGTDDGRPERKCRMTRKRAIKYLMGVAHFDRNTIQKAFADTHKKVPGSSNVQIAAILLENWEDAAIAAHNINFRAAVVVKRFNLEIYHEKELHENPAVRKRPLDDDGKNPFLTYSIDGRGHRPKRHQRHIEETENPRRDF